MQDPFQSGRMELQDVAKLPFDVLSARIKPCTMEKFFARIPIQEQKETKFAYDAQLRIEGYLPRGVGLTTHKMLESHPFGHLIADNTKGVIGMSPVHVAHHIAYDCGNEVSLIYQLLHVEEEDDDDMVERPLHTHSLFVLQGLGREANAIELFVSSDYNCFCVPRWDEELLLFTIDNLRDGAFQYSHTQADRLSVTNGIIAIPPFMLKLTLMRANSTDSKVLCLAAVEAIRNVLENEVEEEEFMQQPYMVRYSRPIS
jgi:hypothetical protein